MQKAYIFPVSKCNCSINTGAYKHRHVSSVSQIVIVLYSHEASMSVTTLVSILSQFLFRVASYQNFYKMSRCVKIAAVVSSNLISALTFSSSKESCNFCFLRFSSATSRLNSLISVSAKILVSIVS